MPYYGGDSLTHKAVAVSLAVSERQDSAKLYTALVSIGAHTRQQLAVLPKSTMQTVVVNSVKILTYDPLLKQKYALSCAKYLV